MSTGLMIGIDIGGTKTLMIVTDREGSIVAQHKQPTIQARQPSAFFAALFEQVQQLLSTIDRTLADIEGIGIGLPGAVNVATGVITHIPALPLDGVSLIEQVAPFYQGALYLDNDVNVAALGEHWQGAGIGKKHMIMLTVGTGIGGAVILNDTLFRGADYTAGEVSYFVVDHQPEQRSLEVVNSHEFGRFESHASGTGIGIYARQWLTSQQADATHPIVVHAGGDIQQVQAVDVLMLAQAGNSDAQEIMNVPIDYMAAGIANMISLLNPECVVIGGGVADSSYYIEQLSQRIQQFTPIHAQLVPAVLGNVAGALGAVYGVLNDPLMMNPHSR